MKAAVLRALGKPPRFEEFPDPKPSQGEVIVHVKAASLKNIDKMMASGSHYDSHRQLPVDVVQTESASWTIGTGVLWRISSPLRNDGRATVVFRTWCLPILDGVDDVTAAALPNPALSSWLSLAWRAQLKRGETVLILGATGVAGKLAVQIAKHLGAGRVVAAGRDAQVLGTLNDLGADATIHLDQPDKELTEAFIREAGHKPFEVIIHYLWDHPTEVLLAALTGHDLEAEATRTRLVELGEMAGPIIALPAAALRSSGLELYGGGGGSIPPRAIFDAFPQIWALAASGKLRINTEQAPLAAVETLSATARLTWSQACFYPITNCEVGECFSNCLA